MKFSRQLLSAGALAAAVAAGLAGLAGLAGCGSRPGGKSGEGGEVVAIERYDLALAAYPGLDSAARARFRSAYAGVNAVVLPLFAASHPEAAEADAATDGGDAADALLKAYAESRGVAVFGRAVVERLGDLDSTEGTLSRAQERAAALMPELRWPRVCGVVSTYSQAIILSGDSLALVGLNHYLGPSDEAYAGIDAYRRRTKRLSALPSQLVEALLASQLPYAPAPGDATALSRMLHAGATLWATARLVGLDDAAQLLDWNADEAAWAAANEAQAWDALISRRLLYSTDPTVGSRLVSPAPATPLLHPEAPGRMGAWLGLRIVEAYAKSRPGTSLWQLLQWDFYGSVGALVDSGYDPLN